MPTKREFEEHFFSHSNKETADYFGVGTTTVRNWARKFGTKRKCARHKDIPLAVLSDEQEQVMVGSLLGDGSLGKVCGNEQSYYREMHGVSQREYLEWKFDLFQPFSVQLNDCINNKIYDAVKFHTIRHPVFTDLEKAWYLRDELGRYILRRKKRIKTIPVDVCLTPLSVTVWYLDDGWKPKRDNQFYFSTHGFSVTECDYMTHKLKELGIMSKVRLRTKKKLPEIAIPAKSKMEFLNLVEGCVPCDSMMYKLFS